MTARRRTPNKDERIAACLLMLRRGKEWLIPEPLRSTGTAAEICASVQWDHAHLHALGGDTRPQNITPMRIEDHAAKTAGPSKATSAGGDIHKAAHSKRIERKTEEFKARLLAKHGGEAGPATKAKSSFSGGKGSRYKSGFNGKITDRETGEVIREGRK